MRRCGLVTLPMTPLPSSRPGPRIRTLRCRHLAIVAAGCAQLAQAEPLAWSQTAPAYDPTAPTPAPGTAASGPDAGDPGVPASAPAARSGWSPQAGPPAPSDVPGTVRPPADASGAVPGPVGERPAAESTTSSLAPTAPVLAPLPPIVPPEEPPSWDPFGDASDALMGRDRDPSRMKISGYLQLQYNNPIDTNGDDTADHRTFIVRRTRVRVKGEITQGIRYKLTFDPSSKDWLDDAYVAVVLVPHHELRVGQQKTQFGYENPESSKRLLTVNRALVSQRLAQGPDLRDIGVGLLGDWRWAGGFGVDYQMTLVNGDGPNDGNDSTNGKNLWGRVGLSLVAGPETAIKLGTSYARGDDIWHAPEDDPTMVDTLYRFWRWGTDLELWTPFVVAAAEYVRGSDGLPTGRVRSSGWYATAYGRLPGNFGPVVRAEAFDPNLDLPDDGRTLYTFGAYYDLSPERVRLLLNYELERSSVRQDDVLYAWTQVVFP